MLVALSLAAQILNGRSWVIVDGAVLDVSNFAKRHPGGARLIINAMGTDITAEILGENAAALGDSRSAFSPHVHTDVSCSALRLASHAAYFSFYFLLSLTLHGGRARGEGQR